MRLSLLRETRDHNCLSWLPCPRWLSDVSHSCIRLGNDIRQRSLITCVRSVPVPYWQRLPNYLSLLTLITFVLSATGEFTPQCQHMLLLAALDVVQDTSKFDPAVSAVEVKNWAIGKFSANKKRQYFKAYIRGRDEELFVGRKKKRERKVREIMSFINKTGREF